MRSFYLFGLIWIGLVGVFPAQGATSVKLPPVILAGLEATIQLESGNDSLGGAVYIDNQVVYRISAAQIQSFTYTFKKSEVLQIRAGTETLNVPVKVLPGWLSLLPPLIAIVLALLLKEVLFSLFLGLLAGATLIAWTGNTGFWNVSFHALSSTVDTFVLQSLTDSSHVSIIVFSLLIGAMVAVITHNGGMKGIVKIISKFATNSRSGQLATYFMGVAIFFDDYANTLVVGNTMRPITDKLKISREKLSYIVDATAAPVTAIAFITTWIGAELSYIQEGLVQINLEYSAYAVFMNSLAYSFYPILTLIFMLILILMNREYGPMYQAQMNIKKYEETHVDREEVPCNVPDHQARGYNAIIPVAGIIIITLLSLLYTGNANQAWDTELGFWKNVSLLLGASDTYRSLLWASLSGVILAIGLTLVQRLSTIRMVADVFTQGVKSMMNAVLILVLAWGLAEVTSGLHTADFITAQLIQLNLGPHWMPAITFFTASLIAFATGTSWGTMAILFPLTIPAVWSVANHAGIDHGTALELLYMSIAAVLAGAVLGDHCSPISDTTIMSSLASSCNHIEHVRTQMPYAMTVGLVALFAGYIPVGFGVPAILVFPVDILLLYLIIRIIGKKTV